MSDTVSKKAIKSIIETGRIIIIITFTKIDSANSHAYNFRAIVVIDSPAKKTRERRGRERKERKEKKKHKDQLER